MVASKKTSKPVKKTEKKINVIIYTTQSCPYCHMAKAFFNENKIKYKEIDVSKDSKAADEMVKKSGQLGVPVIDINGKIIIGFDTEGLKKVLKL